MRSHTIKENPVYNDTTIPYVCDIEGALVRFLSVKVYLYVALMDCSYGGVGCTGCLAVTLELVALVVLLLWWSWLHWLADVMAE